MTPNVLNELPERLKKGDVEWLKTQYDSGALADLQHHLTPEAWASLGTAIHAGDIGTVRKLLSGVTIPGVGPLVVKSSNRGWIIAGIVVLLAAIAGIVFWLVNSNSSEETTKPTTKTIAETIATDPQYSTLQKLLTGSGLNALLSSSGPFTMFAPNDAAFAAVPADQLATIEASPSLVRQVLTYHIVAATKALTVADLQPGPLKMLEGQNATIATKGKITSINDAAVVRPDIEASNGVIQGLAKVLLPPDFGTPQPTMNLVQLLQSNPDYSTYTGLITKAGLQDVLNQAGPFTLFAPNNAAFTSVDQAKLKAVENDPTQLRNLLNYTIVQGSYTTDQLKPGTLPTVNGAPLTVSVDATAAGTVVKVNTATIVQPDVLATNGVFQGIDQLVVPPGTDIPLPTPTPTLNVVQVISSNPDYTTLAKLLTDAGLTGLLAETGPYTVFAPNNAAFAALPADQLTYLQSNTALLRQVLAYHIVLGNYPTDKLKGGALNSAEGSPLTITVNGTTIKVNTATIVQPNLLATNGVVQGINQVLVPPGVDLNPPPATTTTAPTTTVPPTTTTAAPATTAGPGTTTAPPPTTAAPPPTTAAPPPTTVAGKNLYQVIAGDPDYSLVLQLIDYAGLKDRLSTANAITVFVPTNGAFAADPTSAQDRVNNLKAALSPTQMAQLLSYAGTPSVIPVSALKDGEQIPTFLTTPTPQTLTVVGTGAKAQIKGAQNKVPANIVHPDTKASNGLVQGIDRFLVPNGVTLPPT